ncbi:MULTISPECIES: DDE-type integrase/transposase/recombinase [Giesbergeria]|uniref:DDE-type integrase/transposase/recombinase n=1 Tax=Giesbergeria sinuosa TaxID=80883 RepID=A0ABV9QKB2_9BURK
MQDGSLQREQRQSPQCLSNPVEQEQAHRAIQHRLRPMLGWKSFYTARHLIAGIKTMHMIAKGQMNCEMRDSISTAEQFYHLAS